MHGDSQKNDRDFDNPLGNIKGHGSCLLFSKNFFDGLTYQQIGMTARGKIGKMRIDVC
jgi:hypothetical protein